MSDQDAVSAREVHAAVGFRNALLASMGLLDQFTEEERNGVIPADRLRDVLAGRAQ